ncbi:MAG TPA: thioredoxin-disulfide reductase [Elusimicrobia bacterium]|nr:thioredoxin-disulfide reductase [Elusimicrobiota bacterium]
MPELETRKVVVVGSGSAGYTAAIYAARADLQPLLFGGVALGGQLMITSDVENFPGFPEPVPGPELMDRMAKQVARLGVQVVQEGVSKVDFAKRPFRLETTEGRAVFAESVVVATGAEAQWLGLPSEKRLRGKGVSACATCDGFFFKGKEVVVVGGGDVAIEEACFLTHFASKVTVVHRRSELRASKALQKCAFSNPKIGFAWDRVVEEILGTEKATGVRLKNVKTGALEELPCGGVFVAIGHKPNTDVFKGQLDLDEAGYVKTDGRARTSVPGVFAAGDCMDSRYRQAVVAAGTGCMAALEAERFLAG